jgi:hypothetical protein
VKHLDVPSFFLNRAPSVSWRLVAETGQRWGLHVATQAHPLQGDGSLTNPFYAITVAPEFTEEHEPPMSEAEWVQPDASLMIRRRLSSVKCGTPISFPFGMPFSSTICCIAILRHREKKGNGTLAPLSATMIADQTHSWLTPFHEVLTNILRRQ